MTLRLLPNYFKKIGLVLFLLTVWPGFIRGFIEGYNAEANEESNKDIKPGETYQIEGSTFLGVQVFSDPFIRLFTILSIIGLIIYALSRDKVFDEFLLKLRMEAMHLTFFLSLLIISALLLFGIKSEMSALYVIELQVLIFLVAKKVKKVKVRPPEAEAYEQ
ncbi:MAG TPA: hypothetical protein VK112_10815 [Fodinibius sp.]|nr:hypothetical protein [Fodinibius sp.]